MSTSYTLNWIRISEMLKIVYSVREVLKNVGVEEWWELPSLEEFHPHRRRQTREGNLCQSSHSDTCQCIPASISHVVISRPSVTLPHKVLVSLSLLVKPFIETNLLRDLVFPMDISSSTSTLSLPDIIANPLIFDNLNKYLSLQSLIRLSRTSRSIRDFVFNTPKVFRYLDLSKCRGAFISPSLTPIDSGGNSWRAERMDENLTEDEFYAGPLRGVLSKLRQKKVLQDVQVLVLDSMASVTNDLIVDIATTSEYNVKILSIRKCININQSKLQQFLKYICRPGRPTNTPRLQGVYIFTDPTLNTSNTGKIDVDTGVMMSDGATLGVLPVDKYRYGALHSDPWYGPTGRVIQHGSATRSSWEETLQSCRGIIAFDAVLCSDMHRAMSECLHENSREMLSSKPGILPLATVALGPEGCSGCGRAPEGAPTWGENDLYDFPLLSPPPYTGQLIDAVRPPLTPSQNDGRSSSSKLVVACTWCLTNRHCDSCHRWWCADCYNPKNSKKLSDLEALSNAGLDYLPSRSELSMGTGGSSNSGDSVKVFNGLCVENCLVGEMMSGAGSFGMWA